MEEAERIGRRGVGEVEPGLPGLFIRDWLFRRRPERKSDSVLFASAAQHKRLET